MNDNLKDVISGLMIDAGEHDIQKLSEAIIKKCAELNDLWIDSGKSLTFGDRLLDYFGISKE